MESEGIWRRAWVVALLLAGALWVWDVAGRVRILAAASTYGDVPPPAADPASPTGWKYGQRVNLHTSADSYHWTMQAQQAAADGSLRVRRVDYDNAPVGREVHWSSPPRWWLALVAKVDRGMRGGSAGEAIERAAVYASPVLLLLLLVAGTMATARLLGGRAAAVFAVGGICVAPLSSAFGVGNVDHHGIAAFCAMGTVLGLAAGVAAERVARLGFIFSAVAGGLGLWISAATQVPVLVALGLAALVGAWLLRGPGAAALAPLWRLWGMIGGGVSALAYVAEYFPTGLGWRLEVNHPLYALAWVGAAELIARGYAWTAGGQFIGRGRDAAAGVAALGALLVLPVTVLLTGSRTFHVSDRVLWSLHADYIEEFAPLASEFAAGRALPWWASLLLVVNVLPLLGAALGWGVTRVNAPLRVRLGLLLLGLPAACAFALTLVQKRWLHVGGGLWLAALAGFVALAWPATRAGRAVLALFLLLVLAPFPIEVARQAAALARSGPELGPAEMREIAMRDVAGWLRRREGAGEAIVLSDPTTTTQLIYFGGFRGVGTLYWENLAGIHAAMRAAGTESPDEAERVFAERGVKYLVVTSWQPYADEAARLVRGLRATEPAPPAAFLKVVEGGSLPVWLRPLPYRLPTHPYFASQYVAVFEYAPEQTAVDAVLHQARYLLANQDEAAALRLLAGVLQREPGHLPALATQAQIFLRRREVESLDRTWGQLLRVRGSGATVAAEDRAVIAMCFAAAGRRDDLRAELAGFWTEADEPAVRRMPPGALATMVEMAARNGVGIPDQLAPVVAEVLGRK